MKKMELVPLQATFKQGSYNSVLQMEVKKPQFTRFVSIRFFYLHVISD